MAILDRITRAMARIYNTSSGRPVMKSWNPRQVYEMLEAYYYSNGVYDALVDVANADIKWSRSMLELKNPTFAVVEFYAKKLWPGTLPDAMKIKADKETIIPAIEQIWRWSNWGAKKTVAARFAAMYGDLFMRVATAKDTQGKPSRVYLQIINPRNVTDFRLDERGVITYIRYDVERKTEAEGGGSRKYWHTEAWDMEQYRRWDTSLSPEQAVSSLGTPKEQIPLSEMGIDFIPWVHAPFCDTADTESEDQRGMAAIWPCISKIDNLHLAVSRLGQMLFRYNRPLWSVMANAVDPSGRPMPAPKLDNYEIDLDGEKFFHFPGMSKMEALVPNIKYEAHAAFIADLYNSVKTDLPELRYYDVMESGNESGIALSYRLAPAVDRIIEVRGGLESAIIRAQKMALTIGVVNKLFSGIGSYGGGDFEHSFVEREVFPRTIVDTSNLVKTYTDAKMPLSMAMREFAGWSDEKIEQLQVDMNAEANVAAVPNVAALSDRLPPEARAAATVKAKDALASKAAPGLAATLAGMADKSVDAMTKSGALANVLEKNRGKNVRSN